jgi:predicted nucleic acid-binding protein
VPATERSFATDPLGPSLSPDTDFIINYLFATEPYHQRCVAFALRLFEAGTEIYVSSLAWMEFAYVIARQDFRSRLPSEVAQQFQLERWQRQRVRRAYLDAQLSLFQQFLDQFTWVEVPLTSDVRTTALDIVKELNLDPHDAVHLASATLNGVLDLASLDRAYRRVDGLSLWNDRISGNNPNGADEPVLG